MFSRQRRKSPYFGGLFVVIAAAACPAIAQQYSLTDLGTLGLESGQTIPYDINSSGQVTGKSVNAERRTHAFLYGGGVMLDLGAPDFASYGYALNDRGEVTGYMAPRGGESSRAFIYSNGVMRDIGTLGGAESFGLGINESGQITGNSLTATGVNRAFLYSGGVMQDIGSLAGPGPRGESMGMAINNSGQVTGISALSHEDPNSRPIDDPLPYHAFLYSNGAMTDLGTLGGSYSIGTDINDAGQVAGYAFDAGGVSRAFLYSNGEMQALDPLGLHSFAEGLNNLGQATGYFWTTVNGDSRAFVYTNGEMIDVNTLVDPTGPLAMYVTLMVGRAINDAGWIVAEGLDARTGYYHAYLLTPSALPLPAAMWLLLSGLAGLTVLQKRQLSGRSSTVCEVSRPSVI